MTGVEDRRSDEALAAALRETAEAGAVEELYRRHAPAVLAYARLCCRDPHTAEDLASEAFTRTVQAVRGGQGPEQAWRPYLLAVVRHTAADWAARARRVELEPGFGEWLESQAGPAGEGPAGALREPSGEERAIRAEEGGLIAAAFRSLPERWRAVLWHSVVEEEPAARVGRLLGLTPGGVASLASRAREGLREAYLAAHAEQGAADEECRRCGGRLAAAVRRSRPRKDTLLDRHLEHCARCRRAARELTDLNQRLRAVLPAAVLLFGGTDYLATRPAASGAAPAEAAPEAAGGQVAGAKAALAVGSVAVLLGGWLLWPGGETPDRPAAGASAGASAGTRAERTHSASAGLSPPPSPSPSPSPVPSPSRSAVGSPSATAVPSPPRGALGGPSALRFVSTGGCLAIPGGAAEAGTRPVEAACDGGAAQRWVLLEPYPGDRSRTQVRNEATGLCLTRSGGTEDHAPVEQHRCDAARETQLWNLWTDTAKSEMALRDAGGTRYLGLVEWARADQGEDHASAIGTTRYYYGSASMRLRFGPALLER
ncbi:sigma-70 family RNA polymerase sigma factor [Streptomyces sp. BBFR102]|uniref:sigma-70 family RNA polymerase sigma factor n=1 Tax=Streptomyces sp. BBFR102 TaxID=3448171 RepID=UPI003F537B9D